MVECSNDAGGPAHKKMKGDEVLLLPLLLLWY
jgi:hypothetical protein